MGKSKWKIFYFPSSFVKMPRFSGPCENWTSVSFFPKPVAYTSEHTQSLPLTERMGNTEVKCSTDKLLLFTRNWRGRGGI